MLRRLVILFIVLLSAVTISTVAIGVADKVVPTCEDGHTWDLALVTEQATCTEEGKLTKTCKVCGETEEIVMDALGHDLVAVAGSAKEPSCEEDGYTGDKECLRSGCSYIEEGEVIPADGHDYDKVVTAPTCEEDGYTTYTCDCGKSYIADEVDALGHAYGEWTSNGDGTHKRVCANDTAHVESGNCAGGTATCQELAECSVCGGEYGELLAHIYNQEVAASEYLDHAANCQSPATYFKSCVCGAKGTETFTVGTPGDHNYYIKDDSEANLASVATCTEPAKYFYTCVCGQKGTETFSNGEALGHRDTEVNITAKAPTCTEAGCTEGVFCNDCNTQIKESEPILALGHSPATAVKENEVAATCTNAGSYDSVVYCSVSDCGVELSRETKTVDALGHTEGEAVEENRVEATCQATGSYDSVVYCSVSDCGVELSRETKTIEKVDHDFEDGECKNCIASLVDGVVATFEFGENHTGAKDGDDLTTKEYKDNNYALSITEFAKAYEGAADASGNSCLKFGSSSEKGTITFTIANDINSIKIYITAYGSDSTKILINGTQHVLTKSANNSEYDEITIDTTTTKTVAIEAVNKNKCRYLINTIEYIGKRVCEHATTQTSEVVNPTCTTVGYTAETTCSDCGKVLVAKEEIPASGHTESEAVKENEVSATCTVDGSYDSVVYCSVCEAELSRETITVNAPGHTEGEAVEENRVEATCEAAGSYDSVVYCSVCEAELSRETKVIAKKEHTTTYHAAVAETCTTAGNVEYWSCSSCDKNYDAAQNGNVINITINPHTSIDENSDNQCDKCGETLCASHNPTNWTKVDENTHIGTCEACQKTTTAGHNFDAGVVTAPTCTTDGYTTYTCVECSYSYTANPTIALGHTESEAVRENEQAATCTATGSYDSVVYCSVCGDELSRETKEIPVETHTMTHHEAVASTCSAKGNVEYWACSVCGKNYDAEQNGNVIEDVTTPINTEAHAFVDGECACGLVKKTVTTTIETYATNNSWTSGTQYSTIAMDSSITVTAVGSSNTGKFYTNGNDWRIYSSETGKITISAGTKTIASVIITFANTDSPELQYNGASITSGEVIDIGEQTATFTATAGKVHITAIEVVYIYKPCTTHIAGETKGYNETQHWDICSQCGVIIEGTTTTHTFVGGECTECEAKEATAGWTKATSIAADDEIVLVCESKTMELTSVGTAGTYGSGTAYADAPAGTYVLTVETGSSAGTYAFKTVDNKYLSWSSKNTLVLSDTVNANSSWTVTVDPNGNAIISNAADDTRKLQWNASSPRFACYTTSQTAIQIYKFA